MSLTGRYNTKADIWSLGVVLNEMCFGTLPFSSYMQSINGSPNPFPQNYNRTFGRMITLMLQKDSTIRPSARELISLLNREFGVSIGSITWTIEGDNLHCVEDGRVTEYIKKRVVGEGNFGRAVRRR